MIIIIIINISCLFSCFLPVTFSCLFPVKLIIMINNDNNYNKSIIINKKKNDSNLLYWTAI